MAAKTYGDYIKDLTTNKKIANTPAPNNPLYQSLAKNSLYAQGLMGGTAGGAAGGTKAGTAVQNMPSAGANTFAGANAFKASGGTGIGTAMGAAAGAGNGAYAGAIKNYGTSGTASQITPYSPAAGLGIQRTSGTAAGTAAAGGASPSSYTPGIYEDMKRLYDAGYSADDIRSEFMNSAAYPYTESEIDSSIAQFFADLAATPAPEVIPEQPAPEATPEPTAPAGTASTGFVGASTKTYEDWLREEGKVHRQGYEQGLREAETDMARQRSQYGAAAEKLGQAGLTQGGYGDHLSAAAFSAMQGAKVEANRNFVEQSAEGYGEYKREIAAANAAGAAAYNAEQAAAEQNRLAANQTAYALMQEYGDDEETVRSLMASMYSYPPELIDSAIETMRGTAGEARQKSAYERQMRANGDMLNILENGYTDEERAVKLAMTVYGYTEEEARAAYATMSDFITGKSSGGVSEKQASTNAVIDEMLANGYGFNEIEQTLAGYGATPEEITAGLEYAKSVLAAKKTDTINGAADLSDIADITKASLAAEVRSGNLTQQEADKILKQANERRGELLVEDWKKVNTVDDEITFFDELDAYYKGGNIDYETYRGLHKQRVEANIAGIKGGAKDKHHIDGLYELYQNLSDNSSNLGSKLLKELTQMIEDSMNANVHYNSYRGSFTITIGMGAESETSPQTLSLPVESRVTNLDGIVSEAKDNQLLGYNGELYIYLGDGFGNRSGWHKVTNFSDSHFENGDAASDWFYDTLVKKFAYVSPSANTGGNPQREKTAYEKAMEVFGGGVSRGERLIK